MEPVKIRLDETDYNIRFKENPKAENPALSKIKDRLGSATGVFASADTTAKGLTWGAEVAHLSGNSGASDFLASGGRTFKQIAGGTILAYTAWSALDFKDAVVAVSEEDGKGVDSGKVQDMVKKFFTLLTNICYTVLFFVPGFGILASIAQFTDLTDDIIDLKQGAEKWTLADKVQDSQDANITPVIKGQLADQKKQHLLEIVKAVISVVGGIFGVLALIYRTTIVPRIIELTIKLAAGIMRAVSYFNKESMSVQLSFERVIEARELSHQQPAAVVA